MPESSSSNGELLIRIDERTKRISAKVDETNQRLTELNGNVRRHETQITVLEDFCDGQVKPIIAIANDNKLGLATVAAKYGSIGIGGGGAIGFIVWLIGKSQEIW